MASKNHEENPELWNHDIELGRKPREINLVFGDIFPLGVAYPLILEKVAKRLRSCH